MDQYKTGYVVFDKNNDCYLSSFSFWRKDCINKFFENNANYIEAKERMWKVKKVKVTIEEI